MIINSNILQNMGIDIAYLFLVLFIIIIILIFLVIRIIIKNKKLEKRINKFFLGKDSISLEETINLLIKDNKYLISTVEKNKIDIRTIFKKCETAYQKMGLVKYDAFKQMGGKLSFSLALLDENNNGFIINSVHSSDGCYSYTKEIEAGLCSITLSKEETEALSIAIGNKE